MWVQAMSGSMSVDTVSMDAQRRCEHCVQVVQVSVVWWDSGGYFCLCSPNSGSALPLGFHSGALRAGMRPRDWRSSDLPGSKSF